MNTENKSKIISKLKITGKILLAVFCALLISGFVWLAVDKIESTAEKEAYYSLSSDNVEALFEISNSPTLMFDSKAYNKFEDDCLGNDNSILISFGNYYEKDGLLCKANKNTVLIIEGKEIVISDFPSSYINIINDNVYYRNDSTREIYKYSISKNENECIVKVPCGEMIVSKKGIAYIDLSTSVLNYISFETMETTPVLIDAVRAFAIIGNSYYCLNTNKDFGIIKEDGQFKCIATDVDRFFCDGNIVIQKGSSIYVINGTSVSECQLDIEGVVVGIHDDKVYVNEEQSINVYNISTASFEESIVELEADEVFKAFYILKDSFEIITYKDDKSLYVENQILIDK